jgi:DNA-binding NarL/FixJ family response regulator
MAEAVPAALVPFPIRNVHALAPDYDPLPTHANSGDGRSRVLLAVVWQRFLEGAWTVVDAFSSQERCYLLVDTRAQDAGRCPPTARNARDLAVLQRALGGEMQKVVALELARSGAAISHAATSALRLLGLELSARRAPVLLILCACAHACKSTRAAARISPLDGDSGARFLISAERPDRELPDVLSPAEREVVRGIVEGQTNTAIARGAKSVRTVANQVASVFRKLGVGSRAELLRQLSSSALASAEDAGAFEAAVPLLAPASSPPQNAASDAERGESPSESATRLLADSAPATA